MERVVPPSAPLERANVPEPPVPDSAPIDPVAGTAPVNAAPVEAAPLEPVFRRAEPLAEVEGIAGAEGTGRRWVVLPLAAADAVPVALEGSAVAIWREVDGLRTASEIARALAADYGVDAAAITADVARTVAEFAARGLVEPAERGS